MNKTTKGVVYCYINKIDGKMYIGKTLNEKERKSRHKREVKNGINKSYFYNAIRKYGWDSFEYKVLCNIQICNKKLVDKILQIKEREFIKKYMSNISGYNMTIGGDGVAGRIVTDEYKLKRRQSYRKENHPMYGKFQEGIHVIMYSINGELLQKFLSIKVAARYVKCKPQMIFNCCKNRCSKVREYVFRFESNPSFYLPKPNKSRKLTKELAEEIRMKKFKLNYSNEQICEEYGITYRYVSLVINNKVWK